jgi:thiol:disulfide interchange protein DsbA
MTARLLPLLLFVSMLGACSSGTPDAAAPAQDAPAATEPAVTESAATDGTPSEGTDTPAADAPAAEAASETPQGNDNPVVAPQGPAPIAGTDYVEIAGGQPFAPAAGKIEVVEVFGYTCPHCAQFEPIIKAWKARQPADVRVTPVAAPFGGYWMPYARAFYTAEALGLVEKTHDAMFRAVHLERSLPVQDASNEQIAAFYAKFGADPKKFANTMSSFSIDAKMKRATQFLTRSGVDSTPDLIVNGKYRVIGGNSFDDRLRITDHLVAMERAAMEPMQGDAGN